MCLAKHPDEKLSRTLDRVIGWIAAAQEPDGYLYTARTIDDPNYDFPGRRARWSQLASSHELYNVGHLYEAAIAHWRATGRRDLLDVAVKNADLVCRVFGPAPEQRKDVPGHQEIELALVKLFLATGDDKYLKQAEFFLEMRGRAEVRNGLYGEYCQDHLPVAQQKEAVGHAVRAGYLYAAMTDLAAFRGRSDYRQALASLWQDIVYRKMYLTGGVGAQAAGKAFTQAYYLPNESAYNETCAAIAQLLWQHRMFLLEGQARYFDVLERILYNGFLAGVALSGDRFFYPNPLACTGQVPFNHGTLGRSPWFDCACCPVNIVRIVPQIPEWIYSQQGDTLYVNLFVESRAAVRISDVTLHLRQTTRYPWQGSIQLDLNPEHPVWFSLKVRIPGWVDQGPLPGDLYRYVRSGNSSWKVWLNDQQIEKPLTCDGYAVIARQWHPGDQVRIELPVETRYVVAHPQVEADRGRVALVRGPLVYCMEAIDNDGSVYDLVLPADTKLSERWEPELLGGVVVVQAEGRRVRRTSDGTLKVEPTQVTAIPYYAWAHRQVGQMVVWIAQDPEHARPRPAPTLASQSRASASHCWQNDTVSALNDQIEPTSSIDHSIPRLTFWDRMGSRVEQVAFRWRGGTVE